MARPQFRFRLADYLLGSRKKQYIYSLSQFDNWRGWDSGRRNDYLTPADQLAANIGWCAAANDAIVEPTSAIKLRLYRRKRDGDKEEIKEHELLDLLDNPNSAFTGEQMLQLHYTYINFIGESYIYMRRGDNEFIPRRGQLPYALDIFPAHEVDFKLGDTFSKSVVKHAQAEYPIGAFIRDIRPDPCRLYYGRSIISKAASSIDTDEQMKDWNRRVFENDARPGLVFTTKNPTGAEMSEEAYERWKAQFTDEHGGRNNAYKPLLIENGDVKPYMLNPKDLDFLQSREFSKEEILMMWKVSPGILGGVKDVNKANLEAGFLLHAIVNERPRVRQFVRQLNVTLVKPYDESLELGFEDPVPEDVDAKLKQASEGVNKWYTIDEVRDMYGEKPLPDDLGTQIYMPTTNSPLERIANPPDPPADNSNADGGTPPEDPNSKDTPTKALPLKKKPSRTMNANQLAMQRLQDALDKL